MGNLTSKPQNSSTTGDAQIKELTNLVETLKEQNKDQNNLIQLLKTQIRSSNYIKGNRHTDVLKEDEEKINVCRKNGEYEYLVFSGGSIKATSFAGALTVLNDKHILKNIKGFAGTSAGSILASLLAVGYTAPEIKDILYGLDFKKILTDNLNFIREGYNFIKNYGVCPGEELEKELGKLIKAKTGNADYTLEDLYRDKNIKLVIVTTNLMYRRSNYLYAGNPITELSNISIRSAVRMSVGIPIIFEPVKYTNNKFKDYFVDGGVLDNFPLHVFDGEYPGDPKARLNLIKPNPKVLGINIMTSDDITDYNFTVRDDITSEFDYFYRFLDVFLTENERRIMVPSFWMRTIIIVTPDYPLTQYNLTQEQKDELIQLGKNYTTNFFNSEKNICHCTD
jgi:predicted acylesterase/phospholipase RssA